MADRPIIFSAPMVRALIDGRKTQTRRIISDGDVYEDISSEAAEDFELRGWDIFGRGEALCAAQVRWDVGDRLWVRERGWISKNKMAFEPLVGNFVDAAPASPDGTPYKACPSIHMPRWASRLTLAVTDVRVERLQDISEADAEAEGIETDVWDMAPVAKRYGTDGWFVGWPMGISEPSISVEAEQVDRRSFASLWSAIHGPAAWDANPWVAAISFTVHRANIDALLSSEAAA